MPTGSIFHKEGLPSQRLVKRRKIDVLEKPLDAKTPSKESKDDEVTKPDTYEPSEESESDSEDMELEQQRLEQLQKSRTEKATPNTAVTKSSDFDVLFQNKQRHKHSSSSPINNKEASAAHQQFMKKMFK